MADIKSTLYNLLAPLVRHWLKGSITGKRIKGSNMVLHYDRSQHLGFLFSREIVYEPAFRSVLLDQIIPGSLVFEIGSNIGQYSLQISEKLGPKGKLICVEPDSDNFAMLTHNVKSNECKNITLVHKAVSDQEGRMKMYKDTTTGGRMSSLIREFSGMQRDGETEEVNVTTFSKLIEEFGVPSFVKVDVEGAENLVFTHTSSVNIHTTYIIEVRKETKSHIFDLFTQAGFTIYLLERNKEEINQTADIPDFANLLIKYPHI